ncbi:MAG: DNA modification methylase [Cyanophyceae cyanobacterium]
MKTQKVQIETIKLDPSNPRSITKEAFESLKQSITDFPEMQSVKPLVVADGYALAGNMRLLAYKDLGYRELHVLDVSEWSQAKRDEFMIKDNTHYGTWDYDALANEWDNLPLTDWGLDVWEPEVEELKGLTDEDDVPEAPQEPITKLGDVWILGEHRVMCGDSTSKEAVEILIDGEKADMVFTDPPYGVDYKGINNDSRKGLEDLLRLSFDNIEKVSKKGASFYCFHSDKCADIFHKIYREFCHFSSMIIWVKESIVLSQTDYQSKHEPCLYGWFDNGTHKWYSDRKQESVWTAKSKRIEGHTTPKPIEIITKALINSSERNSLVIDLFLGSGSTLIAAEKTNRKCYGMELDPKYCDVIIKRWEEFTGKKAHLEENEFEVITQAN